MCLPYRRFSRLAQGCKLNLLIPPPLVVALLAGAMWLAPGPTLEIAHRVPISIALALLALGVALAAALELWRAGTTLNPMAPETSRALATRGAYAWSRNPIYVADAVLLLAWAVYLANPVALAAIPLFVAWIGRFQIAPEERVLRERFPEYEAYSRRVRRWI